MENIGDLTLAPPRKKRKGNSGLSLPPVNNLDHDLPSPDEGYITPESKPRKLARKLGKEFESPDPDPSPESTNPFLVKKIVKNLMKFSSLKDLKNFRSICKMWNTVATREILTNNYIRLNCRDIRESALAFADLISPENPMSKFTRLKFWICDSPVEGSFHRNLGPLMQRIFPVHGKRLTHLSLQSCDTGPGLYFPYEKIYKILSQVPNIESLELIIPTNFLSADSAKFAHAAVVFAKLTKLEIQFRKETAKDFSFVQFVMEMSPELKTLILQADPNYPKNRMVISTLNSTVETICEMRPAYLENLRLVFDVSDGVVNKLIKSNLELESLYIENYKNFELDFSTRCDGAKNEVWSRRVKYRTATESLSVDYHIVATRLQSIVSNKYHCLQFYNTSHIHTELNCLHFLNAMKSELSGKSNTLYPGIFEYPSELMNTSQTQAAKRKSRKWVAKIENPQHFPATPGPINPFLVDTIVRNILKYLALKDVKQCRKVCRVWSQEGKREILATHCLRLDSVVYMNSLKTLKGFTDPGHTLAGFKGLKICICSHGSKQATALKDKFLEEHGNRLSHLTLDVSNCQCEQNKPWHFLRFARNIKSLKLIIPTRLPISTDLEAGSPTLLPWLNLSKMELKFRKGASVIDITLAKPILDLSPNLNTLILESDSLNSKDTIVELALGSFLQEVCHTSPAKLKNLRLLLEVSEISVDNLCNSELKLNFLYIEDYNDFELEFSTKANESNEVWSRKTKYRNVEDINCHMEALTLRNLVLNKAKCFLQPESQSVDEKINCINFLKVVQAELTQIQLIR